VTPLRPAWVEIDLGALADNVRLVREIVGPSVRLFAVCKGDGYGCGAAHVAKTAIEAGADALTAGSPEDVLAIRQAGVQNPVLLYGSTVPETAADVAKLGVIVTLHNYEGLRTFAALPDPVQAYIKLDCGFGRLGFGPEIWEDAFAIARDAPRLEVLGIYMHMAQPEVPERVREQAALFHRGCADAEAAGLMGFDRMVASSRVIVGFRDLDLTAVNPGRLLYGLMEGEWRDRLRVRPVIKSIKSRVIQVKELLPGSRLGYASDIPDKGRLRAAVIPTGFADGLPRLPTGVSVLVEGRRAPVLGLRSMEHTLIDVTGLPEVAVGSEVVLLGPQGDEEITGIELAEATGIQLIELLPRLARGFPRVYVS
jgi:alanine racemase